MPLSCHFQRGLPALMLAGALLVLVPLAPLTHAATTQRSADSQNRTLVRVRVSCEACDIERLRAALDFVEVVGEEAEADVDVQIAKPDPSDGAAIITLAGRARFAGRGRRISYRPPTDADPDRISDELVQRVKLGLVEFASEADADGRLDVRLARPAAAPAGGVAADQHDPWNHWAFRIGAGAYTYGESQTSSSSYSVDGSANRTTENWKIRLSAYRSLNTSSFSIGETTIDSRLTDWSVNALAVRSLGPKWSAGLTGAVVGSTYDNSRRVVRLSPAIEFDVFPYAESSRRSLTFHYAIGWAHYQYEAETIFGRLDEHVGVHGVNGSLGLRQPWGQAGGSVEFTQHLTAPERTRTTTNGNLNIRLARSLSLTTSASYSRIRDQFTLEKGSATAEEVLLRQRQLATGYRYSFRISLTYSFGALDNATVNPRFGG